MTVATKLSKARKLIERGWCQFESAVNADGKGVDAASPDAVSWCAAGAIARICRGCDEQLSVEDTLYEAIGMPFVTWNDRRERTQAEVIEAFKRAEQLARDGAE